MTRPHRLAVAALCTLVLVVLPGWALRHERAEQVEVRAGELARVEGRNAELRRENARLLDDVVTLAGGGERLEHEVRERLGWIRPNETLVVFDSDGAAR